MTWRWYRCWDDGWPMYPSARYEWGTRYECGFCGMSTPEETVARINAKAAS